jgi:hypothetical protein
VLLKSRVFYHFFNHDITSEHSNIQQSIMGCCVNLAGHTCDFSGCNLSNHEQLLWRHDNYANRICSATLPAVVDFEAEG